MTKSEALNTLMKMRAWRRWGKGEQNEKDRPEMPEQKEVDEAFDVCIEMISKSSLPSNLDEAAKEYEHNLGYYECMNQWPSVAFKAGAEWATNELFENNRLRDCEALSEEDYKLESDFVDAHINKNHRTPTFLDAIKYGAELMAAQERAIWNSSRTILPEGNKSQILSFDDEGYFYLGGNPHPDSVEWCFAKELLPEIHKK